jgi:DNA-binding CsgD family transcriptional regulator
MRMTERQREILLLIAEGLTDAEIARRVGLTVEGVKAHVSRLLQLTGNTRRVQLVVFAHRTQLIAPAA